MEVSTAKTVGWVYILIFTLAFHVYAFYAPTASMFENTYERNYRPTDLFFSQRWSPYFFYIGSIVFLCLVPITLAFSLDDTEGSQSRGGSLVFRRFVLHIIVVSVLLIWFGITTLVFGSINWANANRPEASNAYNPANDDRWCCFYYTLETGCFTKQPCNAGGSVSDLKTNGVFLFQYWFSVAFILAMMIDVLLVVFLYLPSFRKAAEKQGLEEALLDTSKPPQNTKNRIAQAISYKSRK
jgi:hypothetical protein